MQNQLQMECYFKSSDLAELGAEADDIVIRCTVTFPPGASPTFEITATGFSSGADSSPSKGGCPQPCP